MSHIFRLLGYPRIKAVTIHDVEIRSSPREKEMNKATGELVKELMRVERSSAEIRRAIAAGALRFVGGEDEK